MPSPLSSFRKTRPHPGFSRAVLPHASITGDVYLLLGVSQDPCCEAVRAALEARGLTARLLTDPFSEPLRSSWRLDSSTSTSHLAWDGEDPIGEEEIRGVLVRGPAGVDPRGWRAEDAAYMQAELQAAVLGWLWSLPCPVVNRYPASIWYRPQAPLLTWQPLLRRCGIPVPEALLTNIEEEARAFGRPAGAVYTPLTSAAGYLVAREEEWAGLAGMQRHTPVWLARPHGEPELACVVGERVLWNAAPTGEAQALEPALRRFAAAAELAWVTVALAPTAQGLRTVAVDPWPDPRWFDPAVQERIVAALVDLLAPTTAASLSHGA